ncbi:PKD domain-containing protein [Streptomyces sp. NRRL F-2747]|uniref:PKD domain-containing protein n=1 Tax=Streptomyces sp. NRRL F-2747 TaxID=1463843 RepID=UPI000A6E62F2|nr:PKD domain-containing protein [Streptomyces sp. NRRL F-2747]
MRPTRTVVLLTAGLVTLLGVPAAAAADTPAALYVGEAEANCSDTGSGSQAVPFCTISAAAAIVRPGQTVRIGPGLYEEAVTIDRSGEPGKPITFVGDANRVNDAHLTRALTISGAGHVVVRGLNPTGGVKVVRSADVELDRLEASRGRLEGLVIGEGSTDVRVSRSRLTGLRVEGGSRGTVLSRNLVYDGGRSPLAVVDAPGTIVTNNTLSGYCDATVAVSGTSAGSGLFNNLLYSESTSTRCQSAAPRVGISVAQSAAEGTRADYNLITGDSALAAAYSWSAAAYANPAVLSAATGQGAHDILTPSAEGVGQTADSPTTDSADATAPGVIPTDFSGNPNSDDPGAPNTGKDGGYLDRGADETQDYLSQVWMGIDEPWAPVGTAVTVDAGSNSHWPQAMTYRADFGDGSAPVTLQPTGTGGPKATHVYTSPCSCTVKVTGTNAGGVAFSAEKTARVTPAGPLTAAFTADPVLPTSDNPIGYTRPLTLRVSTSGTIAPWPVESTDIDYGDGSVDRNVSSAPADHTYGAPGEYKVTVIVRDTKGATSTATRSVKVDYAPSGYVATAPFRLLDTRANGTVLWGGSPTAVTLPVGISVPDHVLSGSMAAAVLNVTVTGATEDTHLSVWPSGQPRPATSNVNVRAGGTSSNTVTVPVGADGKVSAQLNSGKAALVVDFVGYYQPGIGQRFSPIAPTRLADTRTSGGALGGGQTRTVKVAGVNGIPADATAVAFNLTGTGSTENAHVIAYPDPAKRPATSNLNLEPGKDKSNQAIVPVGPDGTITLYTNTGSTHLVLDAVGWYGKDARALFTPTVPRRLADTRTTGKLAPGATTTVAGLPEGAVGAALNVTATDSTGPGFLTVYGYGTTRPDASSLNTRPGDTVPNHVTTPVAGGRVSVWNSHGGSTHVITDLLGYFTQG